MHDKAEKGLADKVIAYIYPHARVEVNLFVKSFGINTLMETND